MDQGAKDFYQEENHQALVNYKEAVEQGVVPYFDVHDFEYIVDRLLEEDTDSAVEAVRVACAQHPDSIPLKLKQASAVLTGGDVMEAMRLLGTLRLLDPNNAEIYSLAGSGYILLGQSDKAVWAYKKGVELSGRDNEEIYYQAGYNLSQIDRYEDAAHFLKEANELFPKSESLLFEYAFCLEKLDRLDESISCYNRYLDIDPFSSSAWYNLGINYNHLEQYEKAIEAYDFSLAINESPSALFNKANTYTNWGKYREAIKLYKEYIEIDSENEEAYLYLGDCYFELDNYFEALTNYEKSIQLSAINPEAWFGCSKVMCMEDDFDKGITFVKKAIQQDDQKVEYWGTLAILSYEKDLDQAHVAYERLVRMEPENVENWLKLASIKFRQKFPEDAISILKEAENVHVDNGLILYRIAAYLFEINQMRNSIIYLKRGLKVAPDQHNEFYDYSKKAYHSEAITEIVESHVFGGTKK